MNEGPVYGPFVPPQWKPPPSPDGYGSPHPPSGGFSVEARELMSASHAWHHLSTGLQTVWQKAQEGWGYPGLFGMADALFTAGRLHQEVNQVLVNGAADGHWITQSIADGLVETANDFSNTDTTVGRNFRPLEERAGS